MSKPNYRMSYYVMYALFALIAVVLCMFYFVGYDNTEVINDTVYGSPNNTNLLIFLMYGMLGICIVASLAGAIAQFAIAFKDNPANAVKSLIGIVLLVVVLVVAYALGSSEPVMTGDGLYTDAGWLKISDMMIYSIYFLMLVATVGVVVNLTGIFKK